MILLRRLLPVTVALLEAALFFLQLRAPGSYPAFVAVAVFLVPAASFVISWKRLKPADLLEKMAPTYLLLFALAFGLLLAEGAVAVGLITGIAAVTSYVSLELLFLLAYDPASYPVNGLSRVNIAYVPLAVWYAVATSIGLVTFLHMPWTLHLLLTTGIGALMFRTTNHPGASARQNRVWVLVGILVGAEIGWLGLQLPVSLGMQGALAALFLAGALRVRRYLYDPKPSHRLAWGEAVALGGAVLAASLTAKWL